MRLKLLWIYIKGFVGNIFKSFADYRRRRWVERQLRRDRVVGGEGSVGVLLLLGSDSYRDPDQGVPFASTAPRDDEPDHEEDQT